MSSSRPHVGGLTVDPRAPPEAIHAGVRAVVRAVCGGAWASAADEALELRAITGGITNALFRVSLVGPPSSSSSSVLVRIYGEKTEVLIDREKDTEAFGLLADAGFGPALLGTFSNGRVEGYVPSRALEPPEMARAAPVDFTALIAREAARLHTLPMPGDPSRPVLWPCLDKWQRMAAETEFDAGGGAGGGTGDAAKAAHLAAIDVARVGRELAWLKTVLPSEENGHGQALLDVMAAAGGGGGGGTTGGSAASAVVAAPRVRASIAQAHAPALRVPVVASAVEQARIDAAAFAFRVVYAHNDLLSGNILHVEVEEGGGGGGGGNSGAGEGVPEGEGEAAGGDGEKTGTGATPRVYRNDRVQIIDYEYGGYNYCGFDAANHFCEHAGFDFDLETWYPGRPTQERWYAAYLDRLGVALPTRATYEGGEGGKDDDEVTAAFLAELYRRVNHFALASHCWWGLWAVVQAKHSPIDFDFMKYSVERLVKGYGRHRGEFF
jgi:thiamine kinase-like enzyme